MREKIIFVDFFITAILLLSIILDFFFIAVGIEIKIGNRIYFASFIYICFILFYYSIIKSVLGIILFLKNIFQRNIIIKLKRILFLFIPSLIFIIHLGYFLFYDLLKGWYIGQEKMMASIILPIGCLSLLCYYLLNKTLFIKINYKIIWAIILPVSYFLGYWNYFVTT
jgi:hypothetical protein